MSEGVVVDCPFCAIVRHEDDKVRLVAEGEGWIAFFPLDPATLGHTLIIPRVHVSDLWDASSALAGELLTAALRVGKGITSVLKSGGMNLITSAGKAAEQTVFHLHLHLVPRWDDDGFGKIWPDEGFTDAQKLGSSVVSVGAFMIMRWCGWAVVGIGRRG